MDDKEIIIICGCGGMPCPGALCGYVIVGGKNCGAPETYPCNFKKISTEDKS